MTMEQGVINLGVDWFKLLGPYGFAFFLVMLHFLESRGLLPSILSRKGRTSFNSNGNKEIRKIREDIGKILVDLEKRPPYDWIEKQIKELKSDFKDRIESVHKRIDRIEDRNA